MDADAPSQQQSREGAEGGTTVVRPAARDTPSSFRASLTLFGSVYAMLVAIGMIGTGFEGATGDRAAELFEFAADPFMGLVIGTVATALIQSSSTVSSITVGLVGGGLPVSMAVPIIMGANMGTTITNTLVSLGYVSSKEEFRRAFSAATVHDFFNLLSVVIFLPIELLFHPLERIGGLLANALVGRGGSIDQDSVNFIKPLTAPLIDVADRGLSVLPAPFSGVAMALLGITLIFLSISFLGRTLKRVMVGRARQILHAAIGRGPLSGILSGTAITILVQSSSTTTSLMVPLAGSGVFTVRDIYPFTLGANIGTCITALIAALGVAGPNRVFALQIGCVHLLYNVAGVLLIYSVPWLRDIPTRLCEWLADLGARNKLYVVAYVLGVFFLVPLALIFAF